VASPHATLSRGVVLLMSLACGLAVANVYYAQPLLDAIADEFGINHGGVGGVIALTQLGYGAGLLLLVPLGDLLDRRRLIIVQSLLSVLALGVVALAPNRGVFLAGMAVVGVIAVVTQMLVAHASALALPAQRGQVVGALTSGVITGILLARAAAGLLSDLFGWRAVYLAAAAANLAVVAALLAALPSPPPRAGARLTYARLIGSVFRLFAEEPVLRIRALLALLIFMAMTVLWTPMVLALRVPPASLSHTQIGLFGFAGVLGALGATGAGRLADAGHAQRTTGVALTLMLAAWAAAALLPHSLWGLVVGVVLLDFGLQSVHVSNQSLIYRVRPEAQSRLTAGYMVFYSIGCALGSTASTIAYARAGWGGVCLLGASISVAALAFWASTRRLMPA
jgi:predicted MFS family arabinose efflux permease